MASASVMLCCTVALLLCLALESTAVVCTTANCSCIDVMRKGGVSRKLVDCSKKGLTDIPDGIPSNAEILNLNNNNIANITAGKLSNLSELLEMYLNDNALTEISSGALKGLSSLKMLYLTRNRMTNFPDICQDVGTSLAHLGMDENKLIDKPVPESYAKCTGLLSLVLTKNKFSRLTNATLAVLKRSGNLQSIKLNDIGLTGMEPGALLPIADKLMNLDLSTNKDLPAARLAAAFAVTQFSVKFVGITLKATGWASLPKGLLPRGHFPRLDILHLDDSQNLESIGTGSLDGGSYLTQLFLKECPIAALDSQLAGLGRLRILSLEGSRLSSWSAATFGPSLKQLDLSNSAVAFIGGVDGEANPLPHLASLADGGLKVGGNQLVCNCSLLWLSEQLKVDAVRKKFYKLEDVTCSDPAHGDTIKLVDYKPTGCNTTTTSSTVPTTSPTSSEATTTTDTDTTEASTTTTDIDTTEDTATTPGAVTTDPHGGGTSQASPVSGWIVATSVTGGIVLLVAAVVVLALWARARRRRSRGVDPDQQTLMGGNDGSDRGCLLELLGSFRGHEVQEPEDTEYNNPGEPDPSGGLTSSAAASHVA